jgi:hypothetical protein
MALATPLSATADPPKPAKRHFLTLPRELRDVIWNDLIPRRDIEITHLNTKGHHRRSPTPPGSILTLILTCRQIHDEVLDTLYSKTTFKFKELHDLLWLNPPTQFNTELIRSIRLIVAVKSHSNDDFFRGWANDILEHVSGYFTGLWKLDINLVFEKDVALTFGEEDWFGHGSGRKVGLKNVFLPIKNIESLSVVNVKASLAGKDSPDRVAGPSFALPNGNHLTVTYTPMGTEFESEGKEEQKAKARFSEFKGWVEKDLRRMLEPPKRNYPRLLAKGKAALPVSTGEGVDVRMYGVGEYEMGHGFEDYMEAYLKELALKC